MKDASIYNAPISSSIGEPGPNKLLELTAYGGENVAVFHVFVQVSRSLVFVVGGSSA